MYMFALNDDFEENSITTSKKLFELSAG